MALKITDDELWKWYCVLMEWKELGASKPTVFCRQHNIDITRFQAMKSRIFSLELTNPDIYAKRIELSKKYKGSAMSMLSFCKMYDANHITLVDFLTHLEYKASIERLKQTRERIYLGEGAPEPMNFVSLKPSAIPPVQSVPIQSAEVIECQNDIELTITKGVRVLISPELDSTKIIKIIELLKDL